MQEAAAAAARATDSAEAQITDDDAEEGSEASGPALTSQPTGLSLPSSGIPCGGKPSTQEVNVLPISDSRLPHTRSAKPKAGKSRKRKSAAFVDSEDDEGETSGPKPKKVKKPRAPRPQSDAASSGKGIHKELNCSPALADVIGVPTVRPFPFCDVEFTVSYLSHQLTLLFAIHCFSIETHRFRVLRQ